LSACARVGCLSLAVAFALLGSSASARANDRVHPLVVLEIDSGVEVAEDEVRRILAIELGALLGDPSAAATDCTRVTVDRANALVRVRVDDPITGKSLARTIDLLGAAPKARSRLLALAIVELVSASWVELELNPQPKVPPVGPPTSPELRAAALAIVRHHARPRPIDKTRLAAVGGVLGFFSGPGAIGGGGVQVGRDHARHLGWVADLQAHHGSAAVMLGRVSFDVLSASAALVAHLDWSRVTIRLGGGLRGGAAYLQGKPSDPRTARGGALWAPWVGPMVHASLGVTATRWLFFSVALEGGYVLTPVGGLVGGTPATALAGPWLGLQLGAGIFL
jgi:hypothetical protein